MEGTDPRLRGNYKTRKNAVEKCFEVASERGFQYFAIQDGGQCFGDKTAGSTYMKYGRGDGCRNGKGAAWRNDVYKVYGKTLFI